MNERPYHSPMPKRGAVAFGTFTCSEVFFVFDRLLVFLICLALCHGCLKSFHARALLVDHAHQVYRLG